MICFDTNIGRFNFRSVTVVIHNDHVLIHRASGDDFWALPGGRVEILETSRQTVTRELNEEIGLECKIIRQLWHIENFFEFGAKKFHEIANYFLISLLDLPEIQSEVDFDGIEESVDLIFRWVPLVKLNHYNLQPQFLIEGINNLPSSLEALEINEINA